jgi:hypothetical protein
MRPPALVLMLGAARALGQDLVFGLANIQTVKVEGEVSRMHPHVMVRVTARKGRVQSIGISNEAGSWCCHCRPTPTATKRSRWKAVV